MYDEDLYNRIYKDNYNTVRRIAQGILHDEPLSYDMAQEAFIKLYKCMKDGYIINNYHGWLISTTKHLCINHLRKALLTAEYNDNLPIISGKYCPDDTIYVTDLLACLHDKNLLWYNMFCAHYILGIKYDDLAGNYNISVSTVQRIIKKAKKFLRDICVSFDIFPFFCIFIITFII